MGSPSSRIGLPFCFGIDRILYSLLDLRECLFEICEEVIDVFDTYGDADSARGDAGCLLGFRGKLLVGINFATDVPGAGFVPAPFGRYFSCSLWYGEDSRPG